MTNMIMMPKKFSRLVREFDDDTAIKDELSCVHPDMRVRELELNIGPFINRADLFFGNREEMRSAYDELWKFILDYGNNIDIDKWKESDSLFLDEIRSKLQLLCEAVGIEWEIEHGWRWGDKQQARNRFRNQLLIVTKRQRATILQLQIERYREILEELQNEFLALYDEIYNLEFQE